MGYLYISYSRQNNETAQRLVASLQQRGYTVWIDSADLSPGAQWAEQIASAIAEAEVFITLLSPATVVNRTVHNEIRLAESSRRPIIPVLIEPSAIPASLINRQVVDGSGDWDAFINKLANAIDASAMSHKISQRPTAVSHLKTEIPEQARAGKRSRLYTISLAIIILVILVAIAMITILPSNFSVSGSGGPIATGDGGQQQQVTTPTPLAFVNLVFAVQEIPRGYRIRADQVELRPWPQEAAPLNSLTNIEDVIDNYSRSIIVRGQPILANMLVDEMTVVQEIAQELAQLSSTATTLAETSTQQALLAKTSTIIPTVTDTLSHTPTAHVTRQALFDLTATARSQATVNATNTPTFSPVMLTATALAELMWSTQTVDATPTPETGSTRRPTQSLGTGGADPAISTEIAFAIQGTVTAFSATEASQLSPAEAAQIMSLTNNNNINLIVAIGLLSALALGTSATTLFMLWSGSDSRRTHRRTAHPSAHHGEQPSQPDSVLTETMLEDYQIFISSSDKDKAWVDILVEDLEALGYAVWWYVKDAPGLPFGNEIRSAIYHTKVFLIILSPDSMRSKHIEEEIRWAEIYDRPIIPVEYRPTNIEERFYGLAKGADIDFADDSNYKEALEFLTQAIDHHLQQRLANMQITATNDG